MTFRSQQIVTLGLFALYLLVLVSLWPRFAPSRRLSKTEAQSTFGGYPADCYWGITRSCPYDLSGSCPAISNCVPLAGIVVCSPPSMAIYPRVAPYADITTEGSGTGCTEYITREPIYCKLEYTCSPACTFVAGQGWKCTSGVPTGYGWDQKTPRATDCAVGGSGYPCS